MLAYACLTGTTDGWLPDRYAAVGLDLLATVEGRVDGDGFVTEACGSPEFEHPGTSAEAQASHLLAYAAARPVVSGPTTVA
ncbi:hypothetical protein [Plantactinospora sp. GCM10030261]|uniref:hypothetical protein n=1 Tax=Plantactinospora sp. GCM10030261 TaxID=3273420 RepID=UPI00361250C1